MCIRVPGTVVSTFHILSCMILQITPWNKHYYYLNSIALESKIHIKHLLKIIQILSRRLGPNHVMSAATTLHWPLSLLCTLLAYVLVMHILIFSNRSFALWTLLSLFLVTRSHLFKEIVIILCLLTRKFSVYLWIFFLPFCFVYSTFIMLHPLPSFRFLWKKHFIFSFHFNSYCWKLNFISVIYCFPLNLLNIK